MVRAEVQWGELAELEWAAPVPQGSQQRQPKQDQEREPGSAASMPKPTNVELAWWRTRRQTSQKAKVVVGRTLEGHENRLPERERPYSRDSCSRLDS